MLQNVALRCCFFAVSLLDDGVGFRAGISCEVLSSSSKHRHTENVVLRSVSRRRGGDKE